MDWTTDRRASPRRIRRESRRHALALDNLPLARSRSLVTRAPRAARRRLARAAPTRAVRARNKTTARDVVARSDP